ncbi:MAG: hypothetical protein Q8L11_00095 [Candidatus Moranbacteria bacterium]|nr:hypothetical protein [Candidatus Moranbacteria bacterium]
MGGEFNFQKFNAVGGKFVVKITIAKPGGLSFSSGFYNKYDAGQYSAVQLYFDESKNVVAIQLVKEQQEGTFKLKHREGGKGGYASAISFIKSYSLEKYFSKRIVPEVYNDENLGRLFLLKLGED